MKHALPLLAAVILSVPAAPQTPPSRPPVIDVHIHATNTAPEALARLTGLNVRYFFLAGTAQDLRDWAARAPDAPALPALALPCPGGKALFVDRPCFDTPSEFPDTAWLRAEIQAGRVKALGELVPQYMAVSPADPRLEPYWQMAEEFDLPVGIHMGSGPPAAAYPASPAPPKPLFRMALNDPMLLEEVLLKHKKLRIIVMHAGWPWLDSMIALMYAHPNVYVDTAALSAEYLLPRPGYYRHIQALVEAGFAKRIMFGSDFPNQVASGIQAIQDAPFLTQQQKSDILCHNAARFLRLPDTTCAPK